MACFRALLAQCCLFSPESISKPHRVDSVNDLEAAMGTEAMDDADYTEEAPKDAPWDIEKAPTQVQLVELLQIVSSRDYFKPPFRIAIVVSAWDLVTSLKMRPEEYVRQELPLVHDFLESNEDLFEVAFYGVSAQGARYVSYDWEAATFLDPRPLISRLTAKGDEVSRWLWGKLELETRTVIEQFESGSRHVWRIAGAGSTGPERSA